MVWYVVMLWYVVPCCPVSVVAPTATDADALSTAALVMGPDEGIKLLNKLSEVEGILVTKDQQIIKTDGFSQYEVGV